MLYHKENRLKNTKISKVREDLAKYKNEYEILERVKIGYF